MNYKCTVDLFLRFFLFVCFSSNMEIQQMSQFLWEKMEGNMSLFLEPNVILSKIRKISVGHEQYYDS